MQKYKNTAILHDPSTPEQQELLNGNVEAIKMRQFNFNYISDVEKPFSNRVKMLKTMFGIADGEIVELDSTSESVILFKDDAIILFEKI